MATEQLIVELDAKTAKLDAKLRATDRRLDKLDDSVKKTDKSFAQMGRNIALIGTAVVTAITAMSVAAAKWSRELEVAARRSGETVERMQALAFATSTVNISLEKLGDIAKDTNEKIGEFTSTGGGGFVDFVDVMGLSRQEANKLALEFQHLSGTEVLQRMVSMMEQAGISSNEMSFALEGVASDATDLIPLLSENSKELNRLTEEFEGLNATLTQEQIDNLKRVGEEFSKFGNLFTAEGRQLIADYSEEIITLVNWIEKLGTKFIAVTDGIATGWGNIIELSQAALTDLVNGTDTFAEALEDRTKLSQEKVDQILGNATKAFEIVVTGGTKAVKNSVSQDKLAYKEKLDIFSKYTKAASIIQGAFLEDNKAVQAGIIVADTAAGVMRAFATSSNIYEAYANAAIVAATGVAQLSNLQSASKGGGNISGGTSTASTAQQPQNTFNAEESEIGLDFQSEEGSSSNVIRFESDDSDALLSALAGIMNDAQRRGRA